MKTQKSIFVLKILVWSCLFAISMNGYAYKVRMSNRFWVHGMAANPDSYMLSASMVDELQPGFDNFPNFSSNVLGTPNAHETAASRSEQAFMFSKFNEASKKTCSVEIGRVAWKNDYFPSRKPLDQFLAEDIFGPSNDIIKNGGEIKRIMIFAVAVGSDPSHYPTFDWTDAEIQQLRDWLDNHGHQEVRISFDARNNSSSVVSRCMNPLIDEIVFEAGTEGFYKNIGNRKALLSTIWNNTTKPIIFQMPVIGNEAAVFPGSQPTAYSQVRHNIKWLGEFMSLDFLRSDRVVFFPLTYTPLIGFYPETNNKTQYLNNLTSIALSLMEQKQLFENGIDAARVDSYERLVQNQKIIFPDLPVKIVTDITPFGVNASVNTKEPLTYSSSNLNVATIDATGMIKVIGVGIAQIAVTQNGSAAYSRSSVVKQLKVVAAKQNQTIQFPPLVNKVYGDVDFIPAAATSGLPVSYAFSNPNIAVVLNGKIHLVGTGTCTINATQAGNLTYNPAPPVSQVLTVVKKAQSIYFYGVNGAISSLMADFAPGYSTSTLPLNYTSSNTSVLSVTSTGLLHVVGAGTATITASQPGNGNYLPAVTSTKTFVVKIGQTIVFDEAKLLQNLGNPDFSPATSSSGLPIVYQCFSKDNSNNLDVATVVNNKIRLIDTGSTVISARLPETPVYAATNTFYKRLRVLPTLSCQSSILNAGPIQICRGESKLLTASAGVSYKWFKGTTQVGTSATLNVTEAGDYSVQVTDNLGCTSTSSILRVSVTEPSVWYKDQDGDGKGDAGNTITSCTAPAGFVAVAGDACPTDPLKTEPSVWYKDQDGDGKGDAGITTTSCTAPEGFVAVAGDACPTDPLKIAAGTCGCNKTETSCTQVDPSGINGVTCGKPLQQLSFILDPSKRTNATHYSWWFTGSSDAVIPSADGTGATVKLSSYFSSGQVCVGVNVSTAPYYTQYCKPISLCAARLGEEENVSESLPLLSIYPNPSNAGLVNVDVSSFESMPTKIQLINNLGEISRETTRIESLTSLEVSDLAPGTYSLKCYFSGTTLTQRLVILR